MTWRIDGPERNAPHEEFNERLRFVGGENRYGDANFKVVWAQTETFTAGGVWSVDERYYLGYRQLLAGSGEPCWALMQWQSPEAYGSPESYYIDNYDETTGLQILGEYPYSGRYSVLFNLRWHEQIEDKLTFFTLPLNNSVFDMVAKIVSIAKDVSVEKVKAAYEEARRREEDAKLGDVERHLRDKAVPFTQGAVSFTRQGIRSTVIDKKMLEMRKVWNTMTKNAAGMPKGLSTR